MQTRSIPSQNACRVKADGMGSTYRRRISAAYVYLVFNPCGFICVRLDHNGHNLCKTVCMDVRPLLFSFCLLSEH